MLLGGAHVAIKLGRVRRYILWFHTCTWTTLAICVMARFQVLRVDLRGRLKFVGSHVLVEVRLLLIRDSRRLFDEVRLHPLLLVSILLVISVLSHLLIALLSVILS